ncbi:EAL domain-containing protein [Shewanella mesophila]|uniref:putative bifunctional diguanylate cyclase/phosphodiesterase n=1 Tax=Shewanella mesophila TaxID=2864208 RepID=UPI001C6582C9|nr:EAL domain-containing protein [Shewanella mesophila]QYJ85501.1 EAL domain-containing protein [Shewanella mesophila]
MIDIKLSQQQVKKWQESIDTLSEHFDGSILLYVLDDSEELSLQLKCQNASAEDIERADSLVASGLNLLKPFIHFIEPTEVYTSEDGISLIPILWPQKAVYGALCLVPNKVGDSAHCDNFPGLNRLIMMGVDSIELSLNHAFKSSRQQKIELRQSSLSPSIDLQLFIDSIKEHIWMKDIAGRYIIVNHSVERAWGRPRDQIINRTDDEIFDAMLAEAFVQGDHDSIVRGVQVTTAECQGLLTDDKQSWLETTKVPVVSDDGILEGVIGITRNITSHKAAQEQLEMAASVFENSLEGVLITDAAGRIVEVHGAFTDITGFSRDEVIGKNPRIFNSGRHSKAFFEALWHSILTQGKWHGEVWNRRKSGAIFPERLTISSMYDDDDNVRYFVAVFTDISAQKQSEQELARLVYHDPLTQLPNRMTLSAQLEQELRHAKREEAELALIFIDVDLFKHINDSFGHVAGDTVLVELAQRLAAKLGNQGTLARLGSDEFVALLSHIESSDQVSLMVSQLREVFEAPFVFQGGAIRLTASMGIALYPGDGDNCDTLLSNADAAMHRAKTNGRNNYAFYTQSLTLESIEHLKLQSALHDAIANKAFHLVYQPKVNFTTLKCSGFEALLRWQDPSLGHISPAVFIPVAEKIGLIYEIGLWVLKNAATQGMRWLDEGKTFERISVNVAGPQLQQANFYDDVKRILNETGLPPHHLELEVTESCMMSDPKTVITLLKKLGELGLELSVDDFGTGYSSLNYLKRLPIHKLKIDQSFVRDIPSDSNNTAIAKAVIALGHALNLRVIAEGVETEEQAEFLIDAGCDEAQGYLYSKPLLAKDLESFLS